MKNYEQALIKTICLKNVTWLSRPHKRLNQVELKSILSSLCSVISHQFSFRMFQIFHHKEEQLNNNKMLPKHRMHSSGIATFQPQTS